MRTGSYMNWTGVLFTVNSLPYGIASATQVQLSRGGRIREHRGTADWFTKLITISKFSRHARVAAFDVAELAAIPENTPGTLSAVLNDSENGIGSGALVVVLTNAVLVTNPLDGTTNEWGHATADFVAYAPDGVTDPLTIIETA